MNQRPNILLIICDDLTWGDPACHGNPYTHTPHLDALHAGGVRLTRYCSGPLCTPARAALFTGRHPYRTKAIDTYMGRSILDPAERTLAEVLRDAGYATGLFGKWHLGDTPPCRPPDKGFHESLYHPGGGLAQMPYGGRNSYFDPDLFHNGRLEAARGYCSDIFTDAALRFIETPRAQPWFAYLAFNAPHSPFQVPDEWAEPYRRTDLPEKWARLYGMVANIDHNVGRLLARIPGNTLVIFTSDHGWCGSANVPGRGHRYNAGLRGGKSEMYEGGVRVPCFWRWPERLPAGRDVDRLANPIDMLPTLAAVAGAATPTDRTIDGRNLLPLLTGELTARDWPDRNICMQWHRGNTPQRGRNAATLGQRWKWYSPHTTGRDELYDIEADPLEQHDVAAQHPAIVASLRAEYNAWFDDVSHTHRDNYAPVPILIGAEPDNDVVLTRQDWRVDNDREVLSDDNPGYWVVHVKAAGDYAVTIELPKLPGPMTLRLRCGDTTIARPVLPGMGGGVYVEHEMQGFGRLSLPAGIHKFEAYLDGEGPRLGVRFVKIRPAKS
jgi:arylsulfatase/arylsulfatase A